MASTGTQTTNIKLNQWLGTDKPERLDFNSDNQKIDAAFATKANTSAIPANLSGATFDTIYSAGWHVQNGRLLSGRTINDVPIADLQKTINDLPKHLNRDVTINVLPGTSNTTLIIERFSGPGRLLIYGSDARGVTHTFNKCNIRYNSNSRVHLSGFNFNSTSGDAIHIGQTSCAMVYIYLCSAMGGLSSTADNVGINSNENSSLIYVSTCEISNKIRAMRCGMGQLYVWGPVGTANATVYRAENGALVHRRSAGTITGTTITSAASGSLIVNPSGAVLGT